MFKETMISELPKRALRPEDVLGKSIRPSFFDNLEKNKVIIEKDVPSVVKNKLDGCRRENEVAKELERQYPERRGYFILRERQLCDRNGNPMIDEKTGSKRRIDFVVVKDGKVEDMVEVTSKTAAKRDQMAKEYRIRDNGGNYIRDYTGNVYRIPNNVETRVERRD